MDGDLKSFLSSKCQEMDRRMDDLSSKIDSQRTRLGTTATYMSKIRQQATMIQDQVQGFERHIKKQVEESLLEWRVYMDQQHSEFLLQQNSWQSVMQSSMADTCEELKSKIETFRSNGELATQNMTRILDAQVEYILGQQRKLVTSTTERFEQIDTRVQALDDLMQESQETLSDVKSRQGMTSRLYQKMMRHGPIGELGTCKDEAISALNVCNQSISGSSSQPIVDEADVRCQARNAVAHAKHRAEICRRNEVEAAIESAQDEAEARRGRTEIRVKAAQRTAVQRSLSRSLSEAG
jgi:hypothetical protein